MRNHQPREWRHSPRLGAWTPNKELSRASATRPKGHCSKKSHRERGDKNWHANYPQQLLGEWATKNKLVCRGPAVSTAFAEMNRVGKRPLLFPRDVRIRAWPIPRPWDRSGFDSSAPNRPFFDNSPARGTHINHSAIVIGEHYRRADVVASSRQWCIAEWMAPRRKLFLAVLGSPARSHIQS